MKRLILILLIFCSFNLSGQNFFYSHNKIASCTLPTVTTASVTNIASTTATSGGNVTSSGGCSVTVRGCQWSADSGFSYLTGSTSNGSGTGSFTSNLTSMNTSSTYYVRAYATNSVGTSYGSVIGFTTDGPCTLPSIAMYDYVDIVCNGNTTTYHITDGASAIATCQAITNNPTCIIGSYGGFTAVCNQPIGEGTQMRAPTTCSALSFSGWYLYYNAGARYVVYITSGIITSINQCYP